MFHLRKIQSNVLVNYFFSAEVKLLAAHTETNVFLCGDLPVKFWFVILGGDTEIYVSAVWRPCIILYNTLYFKLSEQRSH